MNQITKFVKPDSGLVKLDSEYRIVNDWSQLTNKGYELLIRSNGNKYYFLNGQLHRESQPSASGSSQNASAIIWANGYQAWFIHDKRHNLNGPARTHPKQYWIDNKQYEENEFWTIQKKCFKCYQIFNNLYDLKIHLEQYNDSNGKDMIEYIYELLLA